MTKDCKDPNCPDSGQSARSSGNEKEKSGNSNPVKTERLASLDALRGFDMFWIVGGSSLAFALSEYTGWPCLKWLSGQMHHAKWHGFTFWDLIFPLFLFLAGVAVPYSLSKMLEKGVPKRTIYWRIFRRLLLLIFLGAVYNGMLKFNGYDQTRFASVLGYIGVAYFFAALIYLNCDIRHQAIWAMGILIGYWAAMKLVSIPLFESGDLSMEGNMASYIDRHFLPGHLYRGIHDPQGLFINIPAISTALLGILTGHWIKSVPLKKVWKATGMLAVGLICLGVAKLWNLSFPINKELWTSSFVVYCAGWSLLLLGLFYLIIDVLGFKKWSFFFKIIGMNSITIYLGVQVVSFGHTRDYLFGGLLKVFDKPLQDVISAVFYILTWWIVLFFMCRKKIFLRV
ncbi:acyltransferase family protein [Gemmatimonadota bacterium]